MVASESCYWALLHVSHYLYSYHRITNARKLIAVSRKEVLRVYSKLHYWDITSALLTHVMFESRYSALDTSALLTHYSRS